MSDNSLLHVGSVFQISLRNVNVRAKSVKGGWKYEFVAEMTAEDFDLFNGHDLTGSCFEAPIECTQIADDERPVAKPSPGIHMHDYGPIDFSNTGSSPASETKPYGDKASLLYKHGFYFNPLVMEKVGTDQEYLDWLKTQPCCVRGSLVADKAHAGDIVPAHVRRISAGAGTGIRPKYSAVAMCDKHHKLQHQHGESAVGGKAWFDSECAKHLSRWMAQTLFKQESMGHVDPQLCRSLCFSKDISKYLPASYR